MSGTHSPSSRASPPAGSAQVLSALSDPDCRAILGTLDETPRSAADLAEACNLPLSTTYRKLHVLTEAGLLTERTRFDPDRNHQAEFTAAAVEVRVFPQDADGLRVVVTGADDQARSGTLAD